MHASSFLEEFSMKVLANKLLTNQWWILNKFPILLHLVDL